MTWVNVEHELPPYGVLVLVCTRALPTAYDEKNRKQHIHLMQRFMRPSTKTGKYYWNRPGKGDMTDSGWVTHWMPLPEPPASSIPGSRTVASIV